MKQETRSIYLSIIIPAYKEEQNLLVLLPQLLDVLGRLDFSTEVLVVDTQQPKDNTPQVCYRNSVTHVSREGGDSYGDAVRTGIQKALGEFIIFMDADGSHDPADILRLCQHIDQHDVIIASRYAEGGITENGVILIFLSQVVNFIYKVVLGLKCKDVSNSFKLYRTLCVEDLKLVSKNFDIVEEILYKVKKKRKKLDYLEIPATFKKRMHGKSKRNLIAFVLSYIVTLLKLRFQM